jgi:uncharacterized protein YsxB (DUF464 family)
LDDDGVLRACKASGHAGTAKNGQDIVCAAVSVLLRTAVNILSGRDGITIKYGAPEKGFLWLETEYKAEGRDFLFTAGVFLIEGLKSVAMEYPKNCRINISTLRRN